MVSALDRRIAALETQTGLAHEKACAKCFLRTFSTNHQPRRDCDEMPETLTKVLLGMKVLVAAPNLSRVEADAI